MKFEFSIEDIGLIKSVINQYNGSKEKLVSLILEELNVSSSQKKKVMSILFSNTQENLDTEEIDRINNPILRNGDNNPLGDFFL